VNQRCGAGGPVSVRTRQLTRPASRDKESVDIVLNRTRPFSTSARRIVAVVVLGLLAASVTWSNPSSATPKLTVSEIKVRIDRLNQQAEVATQRFNKVREEVTATRQQLVPLRANVARQTTRVDRLRRDVVSGAVDAFGSSAGLSMTASLLASRTPRQLIEQFSNQALVDQQSTDLLRKLTIQGRRLQVQRDQLRQQYARVRADEQQIARTRTQIQAKIKQAQGILASVQASIRRQILQQQQAQAVAVPPTTTTTTTTTTAPTPTTATTRSVPRFSSATASAKARIAIAFAMAQLGKPYQYGAAGPNSYDCSGLTMAAWGAAGVSLSHYAPDQQYAGRQVSISQLVPGDLVFYYSLPSHVAMYIGHGMVIHAPHTGSVVQIVPLTSMPIHSATHIG
jgi:cell wall-associated NlpC family hydrolase